MAYFSSLQMLSVSFLLVYYTSGRQTLVWFGYNDQSFDAPFHFLCHVDSTLAINITLNEEDIIYLQFGLTFTLATEQGCLYCWGFQEFK